MKDVDFVVSDDWADIISEHVEVYDGSEQAYHKVADGIPSHVDLRAEFCAEFRRLAPHCAIGEMPAGGRAVEVRAPGSDATSLIRYRKLYAKARVDMMAVQAGHVSMIEHTRAACLLAARKMAGTIATMTQECPPFGGKAGEIRFVGGAPIHWPGHATTGRPRVGVEFDRDAIMMLLASYFVLVPAGYTVVEPEPAR